MRKKFYIYEGLLLSMLKDRSLRLRNVFVFIKLKNFVAWINCSNVLIDLIKKIPFNPLNIFSFFITHFVNFLNHNFYYFSWRPTHKSPAQEENPERPTSQLLLTSDTPSCPPLSQRTWERSTASDLFQSEKMMKSSSWEELTRDTREKSSKYTERNG